MNHKLQAGDLLINRYEIIDICGQGGMGRVFMAVDTISEIRVAVKLIPPELCANEDKVVAIKKNFQLTCRLNHPRIAAVRQLEYNPATREYFLVMEHVDGVNLREFQQSQPGKVIPIDKAIQIIRQLAEGVDYAHRRRVIHRDIKPENIMITPNEEVKILDFGLATHIRSGLKKGSMNGLNICGTGPYIAPETWLNHPHDESTDIYALGIIFYEMVNGKAPFLDADVEILKKIVLESAPKAIDSLTSRQNYHLAKALSKVREDRFATAAEFADALQKKVSAQPRKWQFALVVFLMLNLLVSIDSPPNSPENPSQTMLAIKDPNENIFIPKQHPITHEPNRESTLTITTDPHNAEIKFLNRDGAGQSYSQGMQILNGSWQIEVRAFGFETFRNWITIAPYEHKEIHIKLQPLPQGRLRITTTPQNTYIRILDLDSTFKQGMKLPTGFYKVEVSASGHYAHHLWIDLAEGENKHLKLTLKRAPKRVNHLGMSFIYIPKGTFMMGSQWHEAGRDTDEALHAVTLTQGFYLGQSEVTVSQFRKFVVATGYKTEAEIDGGAYFWTGSDWKKMPGFDWKNPGFNQAENHPVTCVSYNDVQEYIQWLSRREEKHYRLPTEAEWEYAARSGGRTDRLWKDPTNACKYANIADRTATEKFPGWITYYCRDEYVFTAPVKTYQANQYGLYDMVGNVWEWCRDRYGNYPERHQYNPQGLSSGANQVIRGGSWLSGPIDGRLANRLWGSRHLRNYFLGFRLAMDP